MKGYQLVFSTLQNRKLSNGQMVVEWLEEHARALGIKGITILVASHGMGRDGKWHLASFFELAEQPIEIIMNVTEEENEKLFAFLEREKPNIFYTKCEVEFGTI